MRIERYYKEQNKWRYDAFEEADEVEQASLAVHFSMADVYEDVIFEPEEEAFS